MPNLGQLSVQSLTALARTKPAKFYQLFAERCPERFREEALAVKARLDAELGEGWTAEVERTVRQKDAERWDNYYRTKYGISLADYEEMLARQGGRCAICRVNVSGRQGGRFVVDHCHKSGRVRALLCCGCNAFVGFLENRREHLEPALAYIREHSRSAEVESRPAGESCR
jgi:hypothetical protein